MAASLLPFGERQMTAWDIWKIGVQDSILQIEIDVDKFLAISKRRLAENVHA
jgi:hypothetical protein